AGGSLESDAWTIMGYMGYSVGASGHVDFIVGYTDSDYDQQRTVRYSIQAVDPAMGFAAIPGVFTSVNQNALSETESDEVFVDVVIGNDWSFDTTILGGYVGAAYGDTTIDGFRERMSNPSAPGSGLGLFIDEQNPESLIAKVGSTLTFTLPMSFGNLYPYVMGEYLHEFKNDNDNITGGFVDDSNAFRFSLSTDAPDRNFFNVGAGVIAPLSDEGSMFLRYQGLVGYEDLTLHVVELGIKLGF
ncbi:MAG: autotransporter outer membrane beta-barrel domain-containing protein, partial [Gammaproteobacteria bacterium]